MNDEQVHELLYQALETEIGGQKVYEAAIRCAQHPELQAEWAKYLAKTTIHEKILRTMFARIELDPERERRHSPRTRAFRSTTIRTR